jgi:hypothetical protein
MKAAGKPVSVLAIDKAGKYGGTSSVTSEMMAINPARIRRRSTRGRISSTRPPCARRG